MKASPESAIINSAFSVASQVSARFALSCLLALALFGCSGGSSTLKLPSASKLPSTCTAATLGSTYSCTITVTNGTAPFTWTVTGLPSGLTSNASTDTTSTLTISGTPQTAAVLRRESTPRPDLVQLTANVQITVTDSQHHTGSLAFAIMLAAPAALTVVTSSPLAGGTAGSSYSAMVTAAGGTTPYTWTITGLPAGLTFSSASPSATISGTTDDVGTFMVMASVTDSAATPATVSATLSLTIAQAASLMVSTMSLPNGTINVAYSQTLSATGGVTPYKFSLASGALPAGFSISAAGVISGTATSTGTSSFTVKVTDSESPAQTATQALSIAITTASTGLNITTTSPLSGATLGSPYTSMVSATGGTQPYTFTLGTSSVLPAGLMLTSGTPSATVSGTPTATGTFQFTLDVKDSATPPNTTSASFLITVTGSSTLNCPATINLTICGTYVVGVRGYNSTGGPTAFGGTFVANSSGLIITGGLTSNDSVNGVKTITITGGSYVMDSSGDGRGVVTLISSTASVVTLRFALESAANPGVAPAVEFDSSGDLTEGVLLGPETPAPFPANMVLSIPLDGVNGAGQLSALLGEFQIGSNACDGTSGSFKSREPFVTNTAGTVNAALTATGSCTAADANGVGTAQFTISGGTPYSATTLHFTYVVTGNGGSVKGALLLETDALATNQPILVGLADPNPNAGTITGGAFGGFCPCLFDSTASNDGTSSGKPDASIVRILTTAGAGSSGTVSGTVDENAGGTITTQGAWPYSTYTVDADGVGTFTGAGQKTIHFLLGSVFYTLDESAQVKTGGFNAQNAISIVSPGAAYIIGADESQISRLKSAFHISGVVTPSGATSGTLSGVVDVTSTGGSSTGAAASGSYTSISATTGRGTGTASLTGSSAVNIIIYAWRNRRFLILDVQSANPFLTGARLQ